MTSDTTTPNDVLAATRDFAANCGRVRRDESLPRSLVENAIDFLMKEIGADQSLAERLAAVKHADRTITALTRLAPEHRAALGAAERMREKGHLSAAEITALTARAEALAWEADPLLADLHSQMLTAAEARRTVANVIAEATRALEAAAMPNLILGRLRALGCTVGLDEHGGITVLRGDPLADDDLGLLRQHKAGVVALLRAEADSVRPVVVA